MSVHIRRSTAVTPLRPAPSALAAVALAAGCLALPSAARADVESGRTIEVAHTIEFVVLEGWAGGTNVKVDIVRGGVVIGTRTAQTTAAGGLEIAHLGVGDCWDADDGRYPDIQPGDQVRVTNLDAPADVDFTFVRDIRFVESPAGTLTGHARGNATDDGTAFTLAGAVDLAGGALSARRLEAGSRTLVDFDASDLGPDGSFAKAIGGTPGAGDISMDYVRTAPGGGTEITSVVEGDPACSPLATSGLTSSSHPSVNLANRSEDMVVGGPLRAGVAVRVTFAGAPVTVTEPSAGTWSATVPAAVLQALPEGAHELRASFDDGIPDAVRTVVKDVTAPELAAGLADGTYAGARELTLQAPGGEAVRYTTSGEVPDAGSTLYTGPIALGVGQHVIRARVVDAAGNPTLISRVITITAPVTAGGATVATVTGSPAGPAAAAPAPALAPLKLHGFVMPAVVSRRKAQRDGLRITTRLAKGTEIVRIAVFRRTAGGRRLLASGRRVPLASGVYRLRLKDPRLRRALTRGTYEVELTPARSSTEPGTTARRTFRVV